MATDPEFVQFVIDHISDRCQASSRQMFGEYILYSKGKVVALICDNQLFIKQTEAGRAYIGEPIEAPPYPGAKLAFLIEDQIEDKRWLSKLIDLTEAELPKPKPKKKPKRKRKKEEE